MSEPDWLSAVLGAELPGEGGSVELRGVRYLRRGGILRAESLVSDDQEQTSQSFDFKWKQRDTFESEASLSRTREWLIERYGDISGADWWRDYGDSPLVVDAGCGAGLSSLELFGERLREVRYLGADISDAVSVARARFAERGLPGAFLQADLGALPLADGSVDVVFSEGVLHHTDSTRRALESVARLVRPGGRLLFYVYNKKGPIREFTDDYLRDRLRSMDAPDAWEALMPLSRLGKLLGELDVEIDVPEAIDLLEIPAGKISLQRFFYWHVFKAFHRPDMTLEEMHHINFDWYAPANAHRQTPGEVRAWCEAAGLEIEREIVERAGITAVARKSR